MALFPRLFRRSPSVVAIGGGTGASGLLQGLKEHTDKLTAIVTVADDGGSSGRFRKELGMLPPGDIRSCLAALSDSPLLEKLLQHRFDEGELKGHAFGNIFLAALTQITGDFATAVKEANRVLSVRGRVLPATNVKISLVAEHTDGTKTTGESLVGRVDKPVKRLSIRPSDVKAAPDVVEAILKTDLVVLGPGSLYTSVIPNLLIGDVLHALRQTEAVVGYVCNVMTQRGETSGFTASQHVRAVLDHSASDLLDFVVVSTSAIPPKLLTAYAAEGSVPVAADMNELSKLPGVRIVAADLASTDNLVRHNSARLAEVLLETWREISKVRS